jgi:Domain of unknown function (DUF4149)
MIERIYIVILTLLVGTQAAVGYLVAPTLFEVIADRSTAGTVAGAIFERAGWLSLFGLVLLLVLRWKRDASRSTQSNIPVFTLMGMLGLTAIGHFAIRPWIAHVRAMIQQTGGFEHCEPAMRAQFGMLHGASSLVFLIVFVLGLSLILRLKE